MGKRKFIDKKRDVIHRYKVVPRSQQDPLIADQNAPKSVLVDIPEEEELPEKNKYGVYFDDEYDYLQHLKGVKETVDWQDLDAEEVYFIRAPDQPKDNHSKGLSLPSSVFESFVEEPIGMLNKAAPLTGPQPQLDPDVVAELDDLEIANETNDADFDKLMSMINKESLDDAGTSSDDDDISSDNLADLDDVSDISFQSCDGNFEARSKSGTTFKSATGFTEYSITSADLPRSEYMQFFNDRFEAFYLKEYTTDKHGELDEESTQGYLNAEEVFANMIEPRVRKGFVQDFPEEKSWNKQYIMSTEAERAKPLKLAKEEPIRKLKYDCVTIHEARKAVNQDYRQEYIEDDPKYRRVKLTKKALEKHNAAACEENGDTEDVKSDIFDTGETLKTALSLASIRHKFETPEERSDRKKTLKNLRKMRRTEKKNTKTAYKELKKSYCNTFSTVRYRSLP